MRIWNATEGVPDRSHNLPEHSQTARSNHSIFSESAALTLECEKVAQGERYVRFAIALVAFVLFACPSPRSCDEPYDVLIRNGAVYDGSGRPPVRADVGIRGDRIASLGALGDAEARLTVDARGRAVAPGFINMLSWS